MSVSLDFIWKYYEESFTSLHARETYHLNFDGYKNTLSQLELKDFFNRARKELEELVKFDFLSVAEGLIKDDFKDRVLNNPDKNPEFVRLSNIFKNKFDKIPYFSKSGDLCIIKAWKNIVAPGDIIIICNYETALEFRNWFAHGRNWDLSPTSLLSVMDVKNTVKNVLSVMNISIS